MICYFVCSSVYVLFVICLDVCCGWFGLLCGLVLGFVVWALRVCCCCCYGYWRCLALYLLMLVWIALDWLLWVFVLLFHCVWAVVLVVGLGFVFYFGCLVVVGFGLVCFYNLGGSLCFGVALCAGLCLR